MEWGNLHKVRGYAGCAERCPSGVGRGKRPRRKSEPYLSVSVDYMFDGLERRNPNHFAVRQYKKYKLASGKTAKSILISCGARLAPFDIGELREIMTYDELGLDMLGDEKTALFFLISDTNTTYNFLVALAFSTMFNMLCERADNKYGGRLPHHVRVLWDEAANTGQVPGLEKIVAVIRSREISLTLFYQAMSQCKALYKDNAETIMGNMDPSSSSEAGKAPQSRKFLKIGWARPPSPCRQKAAPGDSPKATGRICNVWAGSFSPQAKSPPCPEICVSASSGASRLFTARSMT